MNNHNNPNTDPNSSLDDLGPVVKEKTGGTHSRRDFQIRLQGEVLLAMEKRAKRLGLSPAAYFKGVVEMDLVKSGDLPDWWYTRKNYKIPR